MAEVVNQYRIINPASLEDLTNQVNRVFAQMADRQDSQDGRRGTPTFHADVNMGGNRGTNAANAVNSTDIPPLQQVNSSIHSTIDDRITEILTLNKPVGTIHMSIDSRNPAIYLQYGTWVAFGAGRVVIGLNASDTDFDTVEETGGSKTATISAHTHTVPAHTHPVGTAIPGGAGVGNANDAEQAVATTSSEGGVSVSVVQPYVVVYMWKRTA